MPSLKPLTNVTKGSRNQPRIPAASPAGGTYDSVRGFCNGRSSITRASSSSFDRVRLRVGLALASGTKAVRSVDATDGAGGEAVTLDNEVMDCFIEEEGL